MSSSDDDLWSGTRPAPQSFSGDRRTLTATLAVKAAKELSVDD